MQNAPNYPPGRNAYPLASKGSALLDSAVDSIQPSHNLSQSLDNGDGTQEQDIESPPSEPDSEISRRNRHLAEVIFGTQEQVIESPPPEPPVSNSGVLRVTTEQPRLSWHDHSNSSDTQAYLSLTATSPYLLCSSTTSDALQSPPSQSELAKEAQDKTEVTTSVDAVPIEQSSNASGRVKEPSETQPAMSTLPDESVVTPYAMTPIDLQQSLPSQPVHLEPQNVHPVTSTIVRAFDVRQAPRTLRPGLKRIMALFRRQRPSDLPPEHNYLASTSSPSDLHGTSIPEQAPTSHNSFLSRSSSLSLEIQRSTKENYEYHRGRLFEAASHLGLDFSALNDLLSRSATQGDDCNSTSSASQT
jgi:hypothetical protein